MSKIKLLFVFIFIITISAVSQNAKDSVERLLKTKISDEKRVDALISLGRLNKQDSGKKAFDYWKQAIALSKKINYMNGEVSANLLVGQLKTEQGKYDEAKSIIESVKEVAKTKGYLKGLAECYYAICEYHLTKSEMDESRNNYLNGLKLAEGVKDTTLILQGYLYCGNDLNNSGKKDSAIIMFQKVLDMPGKGHPLELTALAYNNLGNAYNGKGNLDAALEAFRKALVLWKKIEGGEIYLATININIAYVLYNNKDYDHAEPYLLEAVKYAEPLGNIMTLATIYNNLAGLYKKQSKYAKSLETYEKCLDFLHQVGNLQAEGSTLTSMGVLYRNLKNYELAEQYGQKGLRIQDSLNNILGIAVANEALGVLYNEQGLYKKAIPHFEKGLEGSEKVMHIEYVSYNLKGLSEAYGALKDYKKAFEFQGRYGVMKDSLASIQKTKTVSDMEAKYQNEKKSLEIDNLSKEKKLNEEEIARKDLEVERKNLLSYIFIGGFILVGIISIIAIRNYRIKSRSNKIITQQKEEVELQKHLIEEKQKEILDSITYAKRLQDAILPPKAYWKEALPDSFILYKPKDIVAGDFYWMERNTNWTFIAAADCTGHGVPGAMVSVVCSNALNRVVKEFGISDPGKILNKVRELVIETFEKSESEVKDGMDISLMAIPAGSHGDHHIVKWAGANNPIWFIQKGELKQIKADKQPIGKYADPKPFTTHELHLNKSDSIYLFTDGFADQFGGPKGKKFKYKQLEELILKNSQLDLGVQQTELEKAFDNWKLDLEQVDDVCLLGIRL